MRGVLTSSSTREYDFKAAATNRIRVDESETLVREYRVSSFSGDAHVRTTPVTLSLSLALSITTRDDHGTRRCAPFLFQAPHLSPIAQFIAIPMVHRASARTAPLLGCFVERGTERCFMRTISWIRSFGHVVYALDVCTTCAYMLLAEYCCVDTGTRSVRGTRTG